MKVAVERIIIISILRKTKSKLKMKLFHKKFLTQEQNFTDNSESLTSNKKTKINYFVNQFLIWGLIFFVIFFILKFTV